MRIQRPKTIKCKVKGCQTRFEPRQPWQRACGPEHAIELVIADKLKKVAAAKRKEAKEHRERKEKLKTLTEWADDAQAVVNRYVNLRDWGKPCISCDKPHVYGMVRNASHYKSVGAYGATRFHLWNIHSSCYKCNCELAGNIGEYRPRLMRRIGLEKVEFIENHERSMKYTVEYLQRLKKVFAKKVRRLERRISNYVNT